jgi:hypothetical protein
MRINLGTLLVLLLVGYLFFELVTTLKGMGF